MCHIFAPTQVFKCGLCELFVSLPNVPSEGQIWCVNFCRLSNALRSEGATSLRTVLARTLREFCESELGRLTSMRWSEIANVMCDSGKLFIRSSVRFVLWRQHAQTKNDVKRAVRAIESRKPPGRADSRTILGPTWGRESSESNPERPRIVHFPNLLGGMSGRETSKK
jgi:hypothetical protein